MQAKQTSGDLADPRSQAWSSAQVQAVALTPVPLDAQPTEYVRVTWSDRAYGLVDRADVAAAHDGRRLYVRLEWADSETPNTEFPDAAGVMFPRGDGAVAATMGDGEAPVRLWYWQDDLERGRELDAHGPGTFRRGEAEGVDARASLADGRWAVVLSSGIDSTDAAHLGVAVWDGANEERAGIGAVTAEWIRLEIER